MDSLITTFHIDWKIIIAQLINFAVVFAVLYVFALKPLKKLMDERGQIIKGGLDNAEKQKELLAAQEKASEEALAQARAQGAAMMKESKKDAEKYHAEMMAKTQESVAATVAAGKAQLEAEKAKMMTEAKNEIAALVIAVSEKVMGKSMNEKIESSLVEESIKNI